MDEEDYQRFFRLQKDEQIIKAIKPLSGLKWMLFVQVMIVWIFIALLLSVWIIPPLVSISGTEGLLLGGIIILLLLFIVPYIVASLQYSKRFYWITNKRIIEKSGLIGYKVNSIPFERISDIIISRSLLERIFGFGSIHIQTLAGQIYYQGKFGAEGNLQAVPAPEKLQEKIFTLIEEKRKTEHLTM